MYIHICMHLYHQWTGMWYIDIGYHICIHVSASLLLYFVIPPPPSPSLSSKKPCLYCNTNNTCIRCMCIFCVVKFTALLKLPPKIWKTCYYSIEFPSLTNWWLVDSQFRPNSTSWSDFSPAVYMIGFQAAIWIVFGTQLNSTITSFLHVPQSPNCPIWISSINDVTHSWVMGIQVVIWIMQHRTIHLAQIFPIKIALGGPS